MQPMLINKICSQHCAHTWISQSKSAMLMPARSTQGFDHFEIFRSSTSASRFRGTQLTNQQILKFIHISLAGLWIYQGLIPKLLFTSPDEIAVWQWIGLSLEHATWAGQASGFAEILFGLLFIFAPSKYLHYLSMLGLFFLLLLIGVLIPDTLIRAFNPVVMNLAMISLSAIALMLYQQQRATPTQQH